MSVLNLSRTASAIANAVSEQTALAMAEAVRDKFKTDISVSLTGAAGPDAHGDQPAGTVWIGIATEQGSESYRLQLSGMRNTNRLRAVKLALHYVIRTLTEEDARKI